MELDREAMCEWPNGADGMRKDEGAPGLRVATVKAGRLLPDVAFASGDSEAAPSSGAVALITVAAVEVVSCVGDGDGGRGGTLSTEWPSSGFSFSSEGSSSAGGATSLIGASGSGEDAAASGSSDAEVTVVTLEADWGDENDNRDSGALASCGSLLSDDRARACVAATLGPGKPSRDGRSSNSGGGPCRLTSDADAYATASGPYGTPNLLTDSIDEMSLSCSGVGPERGYTKSVRTAVCVRGAEIDAIDISDGEVSPPTTLVADRERAPNVEDVTLRIDSEFDGVVRWPTSGERAPTGRLDRFDGRGGEETAASREGREGREMVTGWAEG
jgi:hypothetical protein